MAENLTVAFYTLGCKVNQYESEALRERMIERGFTSAAEGKPAFVSIINTCSVTNISDRKSRQLIRKARKRNPDGIVAVIGCYAQINPNQLESMEEVDIILESRDKSRLPDIICDFIFKNQNKTIDDTKADLIKYAKADSDYKDVRRINYDPMPFDDLGPVTDMDARSRALIKIQDGCDRYCAYCIIPIARGHVRSRDFEDAAAEARRLIVDAGFRELVVTGVNLALYGTDFSNNIGFANNKGIKDGVGFVNNKGFANSAGFTNGTGFANNEDSKPGLLSLLSRINDLPGNFRIRLGSLEPTVINADFL